MSEDRCPRCDRVECPRMRRERRVMPTELRAAFGRMLDAANADPPRPLRESDKQLAHADAKEANRATADCAAVLMTLRRETGSVIAVLSPGRARHCRRTW